MRLLRIDINEFRSIDDGWLPAHGLVVLFGPNSAGKTSVLEAAEQIVSEAGLLRSDPADPEEAYVLGSLVFELPAADIAGSEDSQLFASLLRGEYVTPGVFDHTTEPWAWLGEDIRSQLTGMSLSEAKDLLTDLMAKAGQAGDVGDRSLLAAYLLDPAGAYFTADGINVNLHAFGPELPAGALDVARRIASVPGSDDDKLWRIATDLVSQGSAFITWIASGTEGKKRFAAAFPPVIDLDGRPETLSAALQHALPIIHNRLWHIDPKVIDEEPMRVELHDPFPMTGWSGSVSEHYTVDPWLEVQSEGGESELPDFFGPLNSGEWHRVRHSILAAARLIEDEANRIAPGFVQSQGTIGVEVLPVSLWGEGRPRIRATFALDNDEPRDLRVLGAGTARWVAGAVRLACHRLEHGYQKVTDQDGALVSESVSRGEAVQQARATPLTQNTVTLEPSDATAFYIADEPEAHLHPAALRSVQEWLARLAETAATVLVATHSTTMLDISSELVNRVLVIRDGGFTRLRTMTSALDEELGRYSEELGISEGELLLLSRLAVFVEGPHDQIILEEWFGDSFRSAGIHVFPVHGVDNMRGLVDSEIVAALGLRIAAISDSTTIDRNSANVPETRGERAIIRMVAEATRAGVEVQAFGLSEPDILYYLDTEICQQEALKFPGWHEAQRQRAHAKDRTPWKRRIENEYGLALSREHIRQLARECKVQGRVPDELSRTARALVAYSLTRIE